MVGIRSLYVWPESSERMASLALRSQSSVWSSRSRLLRVEGGRVTEEAGVRERSLKTRMVGVEGRAKWVKRSGEEEV